MKLVTVFLLLSLTASFPKINGEDTSSIVDAFNDFTDWCQQKQLFPADNAMAMKLYGSLPGHEGQRIGIVAATDIEPGEIVLNISSTAYMTSSILNSLPEEPFLDTATWTRDLKTPELWLSQFNAAAWILREKAKGNDSEWLPYIQMLPTNFSLPMFYPKPLLDELQSTSMVNEAEVSVSFLETAYSNANLTLLGNASFEEFTWAMGTVFTRTFSNRENGSHGLSLIPCVDLFNHEQKNQIDYESKDGRFIMKALKKVQKGDQLWIWYGNHGNKELLDHYGFIMDDNKLDAMNLFPGVEEALAYFIDEFATSNFSQPDMAIATSFAEKAISSVQQLEATIVEEGRAVYGNFSHVEIPDGSHLSVWTHGRVDPSLFAAFATFAYYDVFRSEPARYSVIADLSVRAGKTERFACDELDAYKFDIETSFETAVTAVYSTFFEYHHSFNTTLDEDQNLLAVCGTKERTAEICSDLWTSYPDEMAMVVKFRAARKVLLTSAIRRVWNQCTTVLEKEIANRVRESPERNSEEKFNISSAVKDEL